jgi:hypothetical protein
MKEKVATRAMSTKKVLSEGPLVLRILIACFVLLSCECVCFAQSPPLQQITSPVDGTVVHPGDKITVVVTPATEVTFAMVALFGEGGLAKDQVLV